MRLVRIAAIVFASFLVLLLGGSTAIYFLVDFDRLVSEQVQEAKPQIEEALGRSVEIGAIHTGFFPSLSAEVRSISVGGRSEGETLLSVEAISFQVSIWKAIFSLGKTLEVKEIAVVRPDLHLERNADGTLSIDDFLATGDEEDDALKGEPAAWPKGLRIADVRIRDGSIRLLDKQTATGTPVSAVIDRLDFRMRDIGEESPIRIELALAAFAEEKNFDLSLVIGPLGTIPPLGMPRVQDLRLEARDVDLAPLSPYLGSEAARQLESASLSARLRVPLLSPSAPIHVDGSVEVKAVRMAGGRSFDVGAELLASGDPAKGDLSIENFLLDLGGMRISSKGKIFSLSSIPRFEDFVLESEGIDLGTLLAYLPQLQGSLPAGARLQGPLRLGAKASGTGAEQSIQASVDLGDAYLFLPGQFAKAAGTPLSLHADATVSKERATIRALRFVVADLDLVAKGEVRSFDPPSYDLSWEAKPFSFDEMVRLAPSVAESLRDAGAHAAGQGAIAGHLKGEPGQLDLAFEASLLGTNLRVPAAEVEGDVSLRLHAKGDPEGDLEAGFLLDAGSSRLLVDGLVDKARSSPLRLHLQGRRQGKRIHFSEFDVQLAELRLDATGSMALEGGESSLRITLPKVDLEQLSKTFTALPQEMVQGGSIEGSLEMSGDPTKWETIHLAIPSLRGKLGASDFAFSASVRNLDAPVITGDLHSNFLDLDALRGVAPSDGEEEEKKDAPPREDDPSLKRLQATATIDIKRAMMAGRDLRNVKGKVFLRDGVFVVEEAGFGLYGGSVSAAGSQAEIWLGRTPFSLRLEAKNVDVQAAIAGETGKRSPLAGRGNLSMSLDGEGTERMDLEKNLQGLWTLSMQQGRLQGADITRSVLGDVATVPAFASGKVPTDGALRDLFGAFVVEDGKMNLQKPLALSLDGNDLVLGGAVGIFGELFLDGAYHLSPKAVATLSGGRCRSDRPLEIPVKLTGSLSEPAIRPDGKKIAMGLAKTCLSGMAMDAAERIFGKETTDKAKEQLGAAREEAESKARKAREEAELAASQAKAEAESRAKALQAEAERKKKEAEDRAKQKAKEAGGGLKKKLGF